MDDLHPAERYAREYRESCITEKDRLQARVLALEALLEQRDREIAGLAAELARRGQQQ